MTIPQHPDVINQSKNSGVSAVRSIFDFGAAISGVVPDTNTDTSSSTVRATGMNSVWMKLTGDEEKNNIISTDNKNEKDAHSSVSGLSPGVSNNISNLPTVSTPVDQSTDIGISTFASSAVWNDSIQNVKNENKHENKNDNKNENENKNEIPSISSGNPWETLGIKDPSSTDYYLARVGWFPDGSVMAQVTDRRTNVIYLLSHVVREKDVHTYIH